MAGVQRTLADSNHVDLIGRTATGDSSGAYSIPLKTSDDNVFSAIDAVSPLYVHICHKDIALDKSLSITSPSSAVGGVSTTPTITWKVGADCATYELRIGRKSAEKAVCDIRDVIDTSVVIPAVALKKGVAYNLHIAGQYQAGLEQ